jgi:glucuronate isomerase
MQEESTMGRTIIMDNDRLFSSDPTQRQIARRLYGEVKDLPIISPHGHTDPRWYAENTAFPDPASLFLIPDHYLFRMLYSKGVPLEKLGIPRVDGGPVETDPRKIWRLFAEHYHLFRGTPSRMWLEHVFFYLFGIDQRLDPANADEIYDRLAAALLKPEFRPRSLYDRFNIEALATTDSPLSSLEYHKQIAASGWKGKVVPAFRPDPAVDPEFIGLGGIPQGPGGAPPVLQGDGLHLHRPRPPERPDGRPRCLRMPGPVRQGTEGGDERAGGRTLPGPDAHGDGPDESR